MMRSEQQFRVAEIDVLKTATEDKIAGVFRFEHVGNVGRGPSLILIADIHSSLYVYERLLDLLNATVDQARLLVTGVGQDPVARFEKLIQRLNEAIITFAEQEATPLNWKRINLYLLELSDGHLCFSGIGTLMNVFFQKQTDGSTRAFDIFGSLEQPVIVDPKKPFAAIVCGDVKAGDVLIAGTNNLERLRSELRLKERLTSLPPITAALDIRNDLEKRGIPDHFVAAVIACQEIKTPESEVLPIPKRGESKDQSTESIEKLRSAEEETLQRLAPVLPPVSSLTFTRVLEYAKQALGNARAMLARLSVAPKKGSVDPVALASLRSMNAGYGNFFTRKHKLVTLASVGVLFVMVLGTLLWRHAQRVAAETVLWNATYDTAADQRNRAESDLIYNNDARARSEIAAAEQALAGLPTNTPDRKNRIEKLHAGLNSLKDRLKKIVKADNVRELLARGATTGDGGLVAPVVTADAVYVADPSKGEILKISLSSQRIQTIVIPTTLGAIVSGTEGKNRVLFSTNAHQLIAVNTSDDSNKTLSWSHTKSSSTVDIVFYGSKLYSLDPQKNQVWRSQANESGFSGEAPYLKQTANTRLANAIAMAIDSSVYILHNDGTLLRFLSGSQEEFKLATIDPPLRAAAGLWTKADAERILISDPTEKRILIFDKNGALKSQIYSSEFHALREAVADEANKRVIVVDGNRLLAVPLPM